MDTRQVSRVSSYGIAPVNTGGGAFSGSFGDTYQRQHKEHYKKRITDLFDEISEKAADIINKADITKFEEYCQLIGDLMREVINSAYTVHSERIFDSSGKQRVYVSVNIVDSKLKSLASDLIRKNSDQLDYLQRMDEIRGLVMDLLY